MIQIYRQYFVAALKLLGPGLLPLLPLLLLPFLLLFPQPTLLALPIEKEYGVSIASGYGVSRLVPIRLGLQQSFGQQWHRRALWPIGGYWEASFYQMKGRKGPKCNSHRRMSAAAFAAVFRFEDPEPFLCVCPYLDIGVGLSYVGKKEIGGRELGIHFQFEDRLGLGFRFGDQKQYDLSYRATHFSNAYLSTKNDSFNLHLIVLGYWF